MKRYFLSFLVAILFSTFVQAQADNDQKTGNVLCGGVERWAIKVLTDSAANTVDFTPIDTTINYLVNLPTPISNPNDSRHTGIEDKTYRIVCDITIKKFESDDDYHLVLSDGIHTLIGEVPDPACATVSSSVYVNEFISARNFVNLNIAQGDVFNVNISSVVVTGVAFVDILHGQTGVAPNNMELHPILNIHFAPQSGIHETQESSLSVNVFPNPFGDRINVNVNSKFNNLENCSLQLFDSHAAMIGEYSLLVTSRNLISTSFNPGVPSGNYIFRIRNNGMILYEGKLLKN